MSECVCERESVRANEWASDRERKQVLERMNVLEGIILTQFFF